MAASAPELPILDLGLIAPTPGIAGDKGTHGCLGLTLSLLLFGFISEPGQQGHTSEQFPMCLEPLEQVIVIPQQPSLAYFGPSTVLHPEAQPGNL